MILNTSMNGPSLPRSLVNHQRIILMSVCGPALEKLYKTIEKHTEQIAKDTYRLLEVTPIQNWDLAAEPNGRKQKR